jgi:glycosyltransferase involved in cell wall biosynthesis
MRILQINKYHYLRSGTERYMFNLTRLLERHGHQVIPFAMHHPRNHPTPYDEHFLEPMDFHHLSPLGKLRAARRVIYYRPAARRIAALLDETQPDVVHLHNIYHHISPAILPEIARRGIPIVHTLHDYKLICPNYLLRTQGQTCELCRNGQYYHAVRRRCLHGSLAWSIVAAVEMTLHKRWQIYERHVNRFIAPSRFLQSRAVAFGVPERQLIHIPYFLFADEWAPTPPKRNEYALFLGRLSQEKGLPTLIEAVKKANVPLLIAGEGPMQSTVEAAIVRDRLTHVHMAGYLTGYALTQTTARANFIVVPSEWYENSPNVILESFAQGRPVVAAAIGGIPELINDGVDGLLVPPGDAHALADALRWLWERPQVALEMGRAGRAKIEALYDTHAHYQPIHALYQELASQTR